MLLDARSARNPANIRINLIYCQKLESLGYVFAADKVGLSSFKFRDGLRKTHVFWTDCVMALQGHPKVVDFGTNRKRVCDFVLVINSNLGPILITSFQRYCGFSAENDTSSLLLLLWLSAESRSLTTIFTVLLSTLICPQPPSSEKHNPSHQPNRRATVFFSFLLLVFPSFFLQKFLAEIRRV